MTIKVGISYIIYDKYSFKKCALLLLLFLFSTVLNLVQYLILY